MKQNHGIITHISVELLDSNFNVSKEWSLMNMLQPDFIDLTAEADQESDNKRNIQNLVAVKKSLVEAKQSKRDPLVSIREGVEEKRS